MGLFCNKMDDTNMTSLPIINYSIKLDGFPSFEARRRYALLLDELKNCSIPLGTIDVDTEFLNDLLYLYSNYEKINTLTSSIYPCTTVDGTVSAVETSIKFNELWDIALRLLYKPVFKLKRLEIVICIRAFVEFPTLPSSSEEVFVAINMPMQLSSDCRKFEPKYQIESTHDRDI